MKIITIFQENSAPVTIEDNDDLEINEYTKKISGVLENNNITLLHTSSGTVIIRPNKISAIFVSETKEITETKQEKVEEPEDIITD